MRTVLAHGVFDVLHIGHIRLLNAARAMGDQLIVSILADKYVTRRKGPNRPINPVAVRMEQLLSLRAVNHVVVVVGPEVADVERMIAEVRPAIYVKGAECRDVLPEQAFAESLGVEVRFVDMQKVGEEPMSTSRLLREYMRIGMFCT